MVIDFIRNMSGQENFATRATELSSGPFPCDTIRWFLLDCCNEDEADTLFASHRHLSSMRSLILIGGVVGMLDPLSRRCFELNLSFFKLLRVLDLEDMKILENHHLEEIRNLVLLSTWGSQGLV